MSADLQKIADLLVRGDTQAAVAEMRRRGILDMGEMAPNVKEGDELFILEQDGRVIVGEVAGMTKAWLALKHCSWVDHTGTECFWADGLRLAGNAPGWSSEYQGNTLVRWDKLVEVIHLGEEALVPKESLRPNANQ